jgi:hypothetical protein
MDIELRCLHTGMAVKGRMNQEVALALRKDDEVVFPFAEGCWVVRKRHLVIRQVDGSAYMTLTVEPRDEL